MNARDKKWIRFRMYLVAIFFMMGLGGIFARAYQLQVLEKDRLASIAEAAYRDTIKLPPKRGTIYDRGGHELAASVEVPSIYAHPSLIKDKVNTASRLSRILNVKKRDILRLLESNRPFVWVERKIPPEEATQVKALKLEGVGQTRETRRYYPGREIGAHIIGFAGEDNQGLEGLEKSYDSVLKGPPYTLVQMQDALGRPFFVSRPTPDGHEAHNIYLSLDKNLQYMAQRALESAVDKAQAKGGQCLILNPDTGEILALAVVPSYNPNIFWKYRPYQWRNRTITDCYEPGSTIKVFLLAAALEEGIVSPQSMFYCEQGRFQIANHVIHDTKEYGEMSVSDIVVFSSNIGAVKIGQKLGYENYYDYLKKFGFGEKTEIDLLGERSGFVRSPRNAREIDQATSYFGQGISTTSLQLAVAMAAIANGGKLMRPFVVKKVTDEYGRVLQENQPHVVRRVLSPNTARQVAQILEGVVSEQGTGTLAAIPGYKVAGKTGTSQKVDPHTGRYSATNYVATFFGFMPAGNAKLVVLVTIDEPKGKRYGGLVAGPVFSEVGTYALNHLQIDPQIQLVKISEHPEHHEIQPAISDLEPEVGTADDGVLPDFSGHSMREVLKVGRALGLNVVLEGTGLAFQQTPQPGSYLDSITTVRVNFRPPR